MKHTNFIPIDSSLKWREHHNKGESNKFDSNWLQKFSLILSFLICLSVGAVAQETWTGATDGDWTKNANWADNSAPLAGVIAGDGVLTIQAGAVNAPTMNLPASITAKQLIVMSPFTIPSGVTVDIDGATLAVDGVVTSATGNLTVKGTLNVKNANMNGLEVGADGTELFNEGTIFITTSGANGLLLTGTGSSVNTGNVTISTSSDNGIQVDATSTIFDNRLAGEISITKSTNDGIENAGDFETSGDITIDETSAGNGIENTNTGTFRNDSLGVIAITDIAQDGINTTGTFENDGGVITIGDGTIAEVGDNGIHVVGGTFTNNSTVSQGGGTITINGVTGDALELMAGVFNNGVAALGDSLGIIKIDNTNGNGIDVAGTLNNVEKSSIDVGFNGGNIKLVGLIGAGTVTNTASTIRLDGTIKSAEHTGPFTNAGILEIVKTSSFTNLTNNAIIKSSAAASSVTGLITNTGIIIDPNNSFGSDLTARTSAAGVTNAAGVIVAPFSAECYADTVAKFLITGLSLPLVSNYLPSTPFTMSGNANAADFDATTNVLRLNMVQSLMDFEYTATVFGTTCMADGTVSISFANVIAPALACNDKVQVSLDANCLAILTPDVILEGDYKCYDGYTIEILEGAKAGTDTLDDTYIGKTAQVMVTSPLGNSCWGNVAVEYKIPPVLTCRDTTLLCNRSTDPAVMGGQPTVAGSCTGSVTFTYADVTESFSCKQGTGTTPDTISLIKRTWRGTDSNGFSTTCIQTINVIKPQLTTTNIVWPTDKYLYCGDNPSTDPSSTGYPMIKYGGDTVSIDEFCLFGLNKIDQEFSTSCIGVRKILRTWTIFDWCRPGVVYTSAVTPGPQLIKIQDTIGPVITNLPIATQIQASFPDLNSCMGNVTVPAITVSDACSPTDSITVKVQVANSTITTNGGTLTNIPFGTQHVIYTATDDCGNTTIDTVTFTYKDNIAPTVICKENLVIALTQNGTAKVKASIFNNGSYDNCDLDRMRVRRMDSCGVLMTLPFSEYVDFQCCDVGRADIMVEFGVWDTTGNFNSCMIRVQVQDKVTPTITCPPDVTVTCDTNLTDLSIFGPAAISGGACNNTPLSLIETRNLDNCGAGTITRTWSAPNTAAIPCTQTITVTLVINDSFNITKMPIPIRYIQCTSGLDIEKLPENDLEVESIGCQLLAVSYNQRTFNTTGECKEVLRTWEIIDWCKNPKANPDSAGYRLVTQIVKLIDSIAPTFTNVMDTMFVDVDHDRCSASVTLPTFTSVDSCGSTPTVRINGTLTNSTGGFDVLTNVSAGTTVLDVKVGTYKVIYTATDGCNNETSVPLIIVVRDNEGPTLFCDDLVTTLTINSREPEGSDNRGWVTVWASDFNCKISDCDTTKIVQVLKFPSGGIGLTTPPADTSFGWTFNCATKGEQVGDLWVRDGSGNWDYVRVTVTIQDNMQLCSSITPPPSAMISGIIETEAGEKVDEVMVNIGGHSMNPTVTGIDGKYQFEDLPMHSNYTVAPEKNVNPLNGVTTFDLVLISKHILGIAELDSPYKQIAADVNKSGSVTAYDLVQLRQLILNITTEFSNNTSWRFVDTDYHFTTDNPAAESFTEVASIGDLSVNTEASFVAVKIGDVNANAIANRGLLNSKARSTNGTLTFLSDEVTFKEGELFNANFTLADVGTIEGYQFTLNIDPAKAEIVTIEEGVAQSANFGTRLIKRGQLTTSWNQGAQTVRDEERMFSIVLRAKKAGTLSQILSISSELTKAEAYNDKGELLNVGLQFGGSKLEGSEFTLYNNKPNPFKDGTTIGFELPEAGIAKLTILDISGRVVKAIDKEFAKGYNEVQIEKSSLKGSGIYFYQLETATNIAKKKMILIE